MSRIQRCLCILPKKLESICDAGCIYRESAFKHLACPLAKKDVCVAPCPPSDCTCKPGRSGGRQPKIHKYYHEVFLLREEGDSRVQMQMR